MKSKKTAWWFGSGVMLLAIAILIPGCKTVVPDKNVTAIPGSSVGLVGGTAPSFRDPISSPALRITHPRGLPSLDEEVWVIARSQYATTPRDEDRPGCGALFGVFGSKKKAPLPLKHTDVKATVDGYIATTEVTQEFGNPYSRKIEAVYIFPLPQDAAINEFVMTIGERRIRGIIREKEEAREMYETAKRQGYTASLLEQDRPNIFTQSVANIEPRKQIDITIRYFNTLAYRDGWYEYVFPMVVGPRFNPPASKDGVGAAAHGARHANRPTSVRYLSPKQRSGHDVSVGVTLNAGVEIEEVQSVNHRISASKITNGRKVTLSRFDRIPNKDFVLRFQIAGETIKSNFRTASDPAGDGYFSMALYPPENLGSLPRQPMEMIFVLDCSGSMSGRPIQQAKAAIRAALNKLQSSDTFQIIRFSDDASTYHDQPLPATATNIRRARDYVAQLHGTGGTMMSAGIHRALKFHHNERKLRFVCFMTDGYIGNEAEILKLIHDHLGASRVFSFGVGQSPNRFLLHRMAKIGRGAVGFLSLNEDGAKVMDRFFASVSRPAMINLQLDWSGADVHDVHPSQLPDLFVGRPVVVTGRYRGAPPQTVRVTGAVGGEDQAIRVGLTSTESKTLPAIWARQKIAHITDQSMIGNGNFSAPDRIRQLALDYNLMSAYTSFVAVDASRRTQGSHGTTVHQSVPAPEGVSYRTTVGN